MRTGKHLGTFPEPNNPGWFHNDYEVITNDAVGTYTAEVEYHSKSDMAYCRACQSYSCRHAMHLMYWWRKFSLPR